MSATRHAAGPHVCDLPGQAVKGEVLAAQRSQGLGLCVLPVVERVIVGDVESGESALPERRRPARRSAEDEAPGLRVGDAPGASTVRERALEVRDGEIRRPEEPSDMREERAVRLTGERDVAAGNERDGRGGAFDDEPCRRRRHGRRTTSWALRRRSARPRLRRAGRSKPRSREWQRRANAWPARGATGSRTAFLPGSNLRK